MCRARRCQALFSPWGDITHVGFPPLQAGKTKKASDSDGGTVIWDRQGLPGTSRVALGGWGHHLGVQSPGLMGLLGVIGR